MTRLLRLRYGVCETWILPRFQFYSPTAVFLDGLYGIRFVKQRDKPGRYVKNVSVDVGSAMEGVP